MLINKVHKQNYKEYIGKLAAIHEYSGIPNEFKTNEINPFKPFYICPVEMGLMQIYDEAATILQNYSITEIKEIRSFLSKDILEVVYEYARAYAEYFESRFTLKDIKIEQSLMDCYFENNNQIKTYTTTAGQKVTIKELYAVLSIKYIKKAAGLMQRSFKGYSYLLIPSIKRSGKEFRNEALNTIESKIAINVRILYQKIGQLANTAAFVLIEGYKLQHKDAQKKLKDKKFTGLAIVNKENELKKQYALKVAKEFWDNDTEELLRTGYIAELVHRIMLEKYKEQAPIINTIKKWIKPIKPSYADKKGRENKNNKIQIF